MNILNKVYIHKLYYLVAVISFVTGLFKEFVVFTIIILVHEMGHIIPALIYKWKIDRIVILPFGGITIFNDFINRPIKEEFIIAIMGPFFQCVVYYIWSNFWYSPYLYNYHYAILFFNLLPIYPLDGSKILNLLFNVFSSYKRSHIMTMYISYIFLILMIIFIFSFSINLLFIIVLVFLFLKVYEEYRKREFIFNKFLFERYLYKFNFKKRKIIKGLNIKDMKRDYKHLFYVDKKYYTEENILNKKFDK